MNRKGVLLFLKGDIKMKKRLFNMIGGFILIFSIFLTSFVPVVKAKDITVIGADQPVVTTESGENVTNQDNLDYWESYNVTYHWSIPSNQTIQAGDQAIFKVPSNIRVVYPTSFPVKDAEGHVIGTFTVNPGDKDGVLTFNNFYPDHHETNISGTITFVGNGTDKITYYDWIINKVGWLNGSKKPTWCVAYNPDGKSLHDVTIVDQMSHNQILDPESISIQYGTFDDNNQFHPQGTVPSSQYQLTTSSTGFTLHFNQLNEPIQITYTTTIPGSSETILHNTVQGSAPEVGSITDNATIAMGGDGTVSGDTPTSSTESSTTSSSSITVVPSSTSTVSSSSESTLPTSTNSIESSTTSSSSTTVVPSSTSTVSSSSESTLPTSMSSTESSTNSSSSMTVVPSSTSTVSSSSESTLPTSTSSTESSTTSSSSTTVVPSSTSTVSSSSKSTLPTSTSSTESSTTSSSSTSSSSSSSVESTTSSTKQPIVPGHHTTGTSEESYQSNTTTVNNKHQETNKGNSTHSSALPQTGAKKMNELPLLGIVLIAIAGLGCGCLRKNKK